MKAGNIAPREMARTFNCGVGMVIVVGADQAQAALDSLRQNGETDAFLMGQVIAQPGVEYVGMESWEAKA